MWYHENMSSLHRKECVVILLFFPLPHDMKDTLVQHLCFEFVQRGFEFTVFMSLIVESMGYPLEVLMGLPTQGALSIWKRSWNFNILFCLANGSLFSFCGNNQLELLLQNDYCVIYADTLHMVWHSRWLLTCLSVLRRASEYTCNISSENTQIFNFCELAFFSPLERNKHARRICPIWGIKTFQNYLNIASYISNLEEFTYYWYYCLLDSVMDSLYFKRYKAFKKK